MKVQEEEQAADQQAARVAPSHVTTTEQQFMQILNLDAQWN
jgi:hypothetical protein